jgi:hypothetical protein
METSYQTIVDLLGASLGFKRKLHATHQNAAVWKAKDTVRERMPFEKIAPFYFVDLAMHERLLAEPGGCLIRLEDAMWQRRLRVALQDAGLNDSATGLMTGLNNTPTDYAKGVLPICRVKGAGRKGKGAAPRPPNALGGLIPTSFHLSDMRCFGSDRNQPAEDEGDADMMDDDGVVGNLTNTSSVWDDDQEGSEQEQEDGELEHEEAYQHEQEAHRRRSLLSSEALAPLHDLFSNGTWTPELSTREAAGITRPLPTTVNASNETSPAPTPSPRWCASEPDCAALGEVLKAEAREDGRPHGGLVLLMDYKRLDDPGILLLETIANQLPWVAERNYPIVLLDVLEGDWRKPCKSFMPKKTVNAGSCDCIENLASSTAAAISVAVPRLANSIVVSVVEMANTHPESCKAQKKKAGEPSHGSRTAVDEVMLASTKETGADPSCRRWNWISWEHQYFTFKMPKHPLVASFEYVLRIDDGSRINPAFVRTPRVDMFAAMAAGSHVLAPIMGMWSAPHRALIGLQASVSAYIDSLDLSNSTKHHQHHALAGWFGRTCVQSRDPDWPLCLPKPGKPGLGARPLLVGWADLYDPALFTLDEHDKFLAFIRAGHGILHLKWESASIRTLWLLMVSVERAYEGVRVNGTRGVAAPWTAPSDAGAPLRLGLPSYTTEDLSAACASAASMVCGLRAPDHDAVAAKGFVSMKSKSVAVACGDFSEGSGAQAPPRLSPPVPAQAAAVAQRSLWDRVAATRDFK